MVTFNRGVCEDCGSDKHVTCTPLAQGDNTGLTRYTHSRGVSTVTVAARGNTLQDCQRFSMVARRDREGMSRTMVDITDGLAFARVTVQTHELLRMASALAALLQPRTTDAELVARAKAYASGVVVAFAPGLTASIAKTFEFVTREAFQAGFEAGRREG